MRKRQLAIAATVALIFLGFGMVAARPAQRPEQQSPGKLDRANFIPAILPRLLWADERIVSAKIPGRISRRLVNDGARVEVDQVLAELDYREAALENERQQFAVTESILAEQIAQETLEEYESRAEANARLILTRAIPYEEYRLGEVQKRINATKVKQEAEKTRIEQSKAKQVKIIYDEHFILSPIKGIVQKCAKRAGESVTPNDLQMFRILATDKLWAEGQVEDRYAFEVREGQRVTVELVFRDRANKDNDARGREIRIPNAGRVFEGKVIFIDPEVERNSGTFWVRAEIDNADDILRAGFECKMNIHLGPPTGIAESN